MNNIKSMCKNISIQDVNKFTNTSRKINSYTYFMKYYGIGGLKSNKELHNLTIKDFESGWLYYVKNYCEDKEYEKNLFDYDYLEYEQRERVKNILLQHHSFSHF